MAPGDRTRLVVLFGGQSAEHEVSCITAFHVLRAVDPARYDIVPIGITRDGHWVESSGAVAALEASAKALPSPDDSDGAEVEPRAALVPSSADDSSDVVVIPLLHGPMGEDGTVQGLLELAGVPYVGAGVLGSALCMDKGAAKAVIQANGLPQGQWRLRRDNQIDAAFQRDVIAELGLPLFVKPANLGSSVGITKAHDADELAHALELATRYDEYVIVEESISGREIEVAVLGNAEPRASVPGEVVPSREFYDFDDKYLEGGSQILIPAPLSDDATEEVRRLALAIYEVLRVDGMGRVDFFYEEDGRGFLFNELNTIPGFTPISQYPRLWEASGLPYPQLIDELIELAKQRHARRSRFETKR